MSTLTSEEYFSKLAQDRGDYERRIKEKSITMYINDVCLREEREYLPKAFPNAVKIYNQLQSDKAKEAFSNLATRLISRLNQDKSKDPLGYYNECKNTLDSLNGVLIAIGEGKDYQQIDSLLEDTFKYMEVPFEKHEGNAFIGLKNDIYEVASPELKQAREKGNQ